MTIEKCNCAPCQLTDIREQLDNPKLRKQSGITLAMQHDEILAKHLTDVVENKQFLHQPLLNAAKCGRLGFIDPQIEEAWGKSVIEKLEGNLPTELDQLKGFLEDVFDNLVPPEEKALTEAPLPEWAVALAPEDKLVHGHQLFTLNGSVSGNGTLVDIYLDLVQGHPVFVVITDAGNLTRLSQTELSKQYRAGQFIMADLPTTEARKIWAEYSKAMYS